MKTTITITIDGNQVSVNKEKSQKQGKKYFIIMCDYDESSWVELVTENYQEALKTLNELSDDDDLSNYSYRLLMQNEALEIVPCGTDLDIDRAFYQIL